MSGKTFVDPLLGGAGPTDGMLNSGADKSSLKLLSFCEREVLQLLAEGAANKHVAAKLGISVETVETCRAKIMQKLDLRSIAGLTKYASREGAASADRPNA